MLVTFMHMHWIGTPDFSNQPVFLSTVSIGKITQVCFVCKRLDWIYLVNFVTAQSPPIFSNLPTNRTLDFPSSNIWLLACNPRPAFTLPTILSHSSCFSVVSIIVLFILKGCCSGYNLDLHPDLININTQVAEQSNSLLNRLKGMVSYMSEANFICHVKLFLAYRNIIRRGKMAPVLSEGELLTLNHHDMFSHKSRKC